MDSLLCFTIPDRPWWTSSLMDTHETARLLNDIASNAERIQRGLDDKSNSLFFRGFGNYHQTIFLHEILLGEMGVSCMPDVIDSLLKKSGTNRNRMDIKLQNLNNVVKTYFKDPFKIEFDLSQFTPELITNINRILMEGLRDNPGKYRTTTAAPAHENWIYRHPHLIADDVEKLCAWVRSAMVQADMLTSVKVVAQFMTNFLHIHPFGNGNGRTARILLSLLLWKHTIVPLPLYAEAEGRQVYLDCLRQSREAAPAEMIRRGHTPFSFVPAALARFVLECFYKSLANMVFLLDL